MGYIYITMLHLPMTVNHQISLRPQYQTTTGYTEKLYHENASLHLISQKNINYSHFNQENTKKSKNIQIWKYHTIFDQVRLHN